MFFQALFRAMGLRHEDFRFGVSKVFFKTGKVTRTCMQKFYTIWRVIVKQDHTKDTEGRVALATVMNTTINKERRGGGGRGRVIMCP